MRCSLWSGLCPSVHSSSDTSSGTSSPHSRWWRPAGDTRSTSGGKNKTKTLHIRKQNRRGKWDKNVSNWRVNDLETRLDTLLISKGNSLLTNPWPSHTAWDLEHVCGPQQKQGRVKGRFREKITEYIYSGFKGILFWKRLIISYYMVIIRLKMKCKHFRLTLENEKKLHNKD